MFLISETRDIFIDSNACDNFIVDHFITRIKKCTDLKTALEYLKFYNEVLCKQINQHIFKEYIDYIILTGNIINLSKYIKHLSISLEKLKYAIFERKSDLCKQLDILHDKMSEKNLIQKFKFCTKHSTNVLLKIEEIMSFNIHSCLPNTFLLFLEREILNLSVIQFYSDTNIPCKHLQCANRKYQEVLQVIENKLEMYLIYFIDENDFRNFFNIFRICSMFNKRKKAERIVRERYVKSFNQTCVTGRSILQHGIVKMYDDVLNFVYRFYSSIELSWQNNETYSVCLNDYDFIVNIIWVETLQQILYILPAHIFSPGDADKFHANYCATVNFLTQFEKCFKNLRNIKLLRENDIYKIFIKKWNLEAYFKIRFIEIAGTFEKSLLHENKSKEFVKCTNSQYLLRSSKVLVECLHLCWDDNIFLKLLSHEFWKLNLQLISRYSKWVHLYIKNSETKSNLFYQVIASLVVDIQLLIKDFEKLFNGSISTKIENLSVKVAFVDTLKLLNNTVLQLEKSIIELLTKTICSNMDSINDIPKLYLKTNRNIPTTPSSYLITIFNILSDFFNATDFILPKELKISVVNHITISFVENWTNSVHSTIMSVQKIEESRKILKRAKSKLAEENSNTSVSDDEKIKMQFMIDADAIEKFLNSLGNENVEIVKKLKESINY